MKFASKVTNIIIAITFACILTDDVQSFMFPSPVFVGSNLNCERQRCNFVLFAGKDSSSLARKDKRKSSDNIGRTIKRLKFQLNEAKSNALENERKIQDSKQVYDALVKENDATQKAHERMIEKIKKEHKKEQEILLSRFKIVADELEHFKVSSDHQISQIKSEAAEVKDLLVTEMEELQKSLDAKIKEIQEAEEHMFKVLEDKDDMASDISDLTAQISSLIQQLEESRKETKEAQNKIEELKQSILVAKQSFESKIKELNHEKKFINLQKDTEISRMKTEYQKKLDIYQKEMSATLNEAQLETETLKIERRSIRKLAKIGFDLVKERASKKKDSIVQVIRRKP